MAKVAQAKTEFERPTEVRPPQLSMLWGDFIIYDSHGKDWIVKCRKCRARWALAQTNAIHTGNILSLMNHADSH